MRIFSHAPTLLPRTLLPLTLLPLALIIISVGVSVSHAQSLEALFAQGNQAASEGDYKQAIAAYRELVQTGVQDPDVHYNLALCFAKIDNYARAIWQFERTLFLRPRDEDAVRHLETARTALAQQRAGTEGQAALDKDTDFKQAIVKSLQESTLAYTFLVLNALFFLTLLIRRFSPKDTHRIGYSITACVLALLLVTSGALLTIKQGWFRKGAPAIVLESRVPLREGPDPRAQERGFLRGGERVFISDTEGEFARIRGANAQEGWAPVAFLGLVETVRSP